MKYARLERFLNIELIEEFYLKPATLLVLGAGIDQSYPIRMAREEGLRVLAADMDPNAPSFRLADEAAVVSNRDINALTQLCDQSASRGFPVSGVLAMGVDIPHIVAELALHLKVPGPSLDTGFWTTDKFLMKERLSLAGVPVPWYAKAESAAHLRQLMQAHGGEKFVIKPTDRSGARGVFLLDRRADDINNLFAEAHAESLSGEVQVEEYIPGDQISTESILWQGKAYTPGFVDRNYEMLARFAPRFIENGGVHPSKVLGERRVEIERLVERAALALGIENGVAKGDVVISKTGTPMIIEMAARLSGGDFSESLIPLGTGVNIVKAAIRISIGREPDLANLVDQWERVIANRYFFGDPGTLISIRGLDEARGLSWVKKIDVYAKPGDIIGEIKSHVSRLGVFIVEASDRVQLAERVSYVYELVQFEIEPQASGRA